MKKSLLSICLILILGSCVHSGMFRNQEQKNIVDLYENQHFEESIILSEQYLIDHPNDPLINFYLGKALYDHGEAKLAEEYFKRTIVLDHESSRISSWSYLHLGDCYSIDNIPEARRMYQKVIDLNASENAVLKARQRLFPITDFALSHTHRATNHINFYFEKIQFIDDPVQFMNDREKAFMLICSQLQVEPDFTIDFIVWDDPVRFYEKYGMMLGFSMSAKGIIHSAKSQTIGHELTHSIVYKKFKDHSSRYKFINEGIAIYYSLSNNPLELRIREIPESDRSGISIKDLWFNWNLYPARISYPVSGAFIDFLIKREGIDKMILLLSDQSYSNAKNIYGDSIDLTISDFETWLKSL